MTSLRKRMLEELRLRIYSEVTTRLFRHPTSGGWSSWDTSQ
jgi:hypothetical protein